MVAGTMEETMHPHVPIILHLGLIWTMFALWLLEHSSHGEHDKQVSHLQTPEPFP